MLTSRQQPQLLSRSAAASIRTAPAKHLASGLRTPVHQNSTECLVLVHLNVTRHPNQCVPVTLCASFFRKNGSDAQKTRQPAPINYRSTQAPQGIAARKRANAFYFGCDYCLSMLVALHTYKSAKGVAVVQRPYDRQHSLSSKEGQPSIPSTRIFCDVCY